MTRLAEVPFSGGSDHYVLIDPATGVPCPMLIQWPDRYYHSSHDTPDKTSPASLALAVRCAATYAGFLASADRAQGRWLLGAVARWARRRVLAALDEETPARARARERTRGRRAIASLSRLGLDAAAIRESVDAFSSFVEREAPVADAEGPPGSGVADGFRPRRTVPVPVHAQRHLLPGWRALPRAARERWRTREAEVEDGATLTDLAWYACDGTRTLADIVREVWLETGRNEPGFVAEFFALTASLGLSEPVDGREEACRPAPHDTAGR
jgi:hypothetical protein